MHFDERAHVAHLFVCHGSAGKVDMQRLNTSFGYIHHSDICSHERGSCFIATIKTPKIKCNIVGEVTRGAIRVADFLGPDGQPEGGGIAAAAYARGPTMLVVPEGASPLAPLQGSWRSSSAKRCGSR